MSEQPLPAMQAPPQFRSAFNRIDKRMDRTDREIRKLDTRVEKVETTFRKWTLAIVSLGTLIGSTVGGSLAGGILDVLREALK